MGAIKNVGRTPVEIIMQARSQGPFNSLFDFASRVDLRAVGRRSMECLVKVGAMDGFGNRGSLLQGLDNIISISASLHRSAENGQLNLFDGETGLPEEITLPSANPVERREQLEWERELIGLYLSDHPISPYLEALRRKVTHNSGSLGECKHKTKVTLGGMVTRVRQHQTRNGQPMAFAALEDLQGTVELVLFPRVYEQYAPFITPDTVLVVSGSLDNQNGDPKVLVDSLELQSAPTVEEASSLIAPVSYGGKPAGTDAGTDAGGGILQPDENASGSVALELRETARGIMPKDSGPPKGAWRVLEQAVDWPNAAEWHDNPEEPDGFWEAPPSQQVAAAGGEPSGIPQEEQPYKPPDSHPRLPVISEFEDIQAARLPIPSGNGQSGGDIHTSSGVGDIPPAGDFPRILTVTIRPTGDKMRDSRRVHRAHGLLKSCPGNDRYAFVAFEKEHWYFIEFPNETTGINTELVSCLAGMFGEENVRIEQSRIS
jgi:DNA polymerase-3 subunit alpha